MSYHTISTPDVVTSPYSYLFLKFMKWSGFPAILFSLPSLINTIQLMYIPGEQQEEEEENH